MISNLKNIEEVFAKMGSDGLDTSKPLKWGFFFIDKAKENLLKVAHELSAHNHEMESLHEADDKSWVLQVSKSEVLDPEKLHKRNISFNQLAEYCEVGLYDGWDVGKV
jgi:hypothetical protein